MPHRRSLDRLQRRFVRGLIFKYAYVDKFRGEVVSRVSRMDLLSLLNCDGVPVGFVPDVERGEVLVDTRGAGSFQKRLV